MGVLIVLFFSSVLYVFVCGYLVVVVVCGGSVLGLLFRFEFWCLLIWLRSLVGWCCLLISFVVWVWLIWIWCCVFAVWLCGWVGGLLAVCLVGLPVSGGCLIVLVGWYGSPL